MNLGHKRIACVLVGAGLVLSTGRAARADVVLEWNAIAVRTLTTQTPPVDPFSQARFAGRPRTQCSSRISREARRR